MDDGPLQQLRKGRLPKMVSWYDPRLLTRVGIRTIVSSVFGQYADQRLMQAVTDRADDEELRSRYDYSNLNAGDPHRRITADESDALWIDYIADVGDGFEPTYTTAYLLAQDSLDVRGAGRLQHGEVLIMGGDQCYPQATREEYKRRLLLPYSWASDGAGPDRKLFAIPGNHDWYDGLNAFDSLFCSSRDRLSNAKGNAIGGWRCQQHRSYWAIRLPYNWWIWGADIQFSKYLDTAQVSYFETMADEMQEGDSLIVCLAQPSWMIADLQGLDEEENLVKVTSIARARGAKVVAVIAGDWHNYNRYYAHELDVHFITSGGGGAFLHPTHVLKNSIQVRWPERPESVETAGGGGAIGPGGPLRARDYDIRLKRNTQAAANVVEQAVQDVQDALEPLRPATLPGRRQPLRPQAPKCYPAKWRSYLLSLRNVLFPFYNPAFAIGIGILYWLITWEFQALVSRYNISGGKIDDLGIGTSLLSVLPFMPLYLVQAMIASISLAVMLGVLYAVLVWYVDAIDRPGLRRYATKFFFGTTHFLAHLAVMFTLSLLVVSLNNQMTPVVERQLLAINASRDQRPAVVRDVIRETLNPLERKPAQGSREPSPVRQLVGFTSYPILMVVLGGLAGGSLWGLYWVLAGIIARMHAEDAFAALRIQNYKSFLRLKFERNRLTIYPVGIDKVPGPYGWKNGPPGAGVPPHNPRLVPAKPIDVRLIEEPIVISRA
jgi:hypothetical protein